MEIQDFLRKFNKVKSGGSAGQYTALCPVHGDNRNSLSIAAGEDGRILLHCHAGCSAEDICAAVDVDVKELFADKPQTSPAERARVVATYNYTDEHGEVLCQKLRRADKSFLWRRKAADGSWCYDRKGLRPVLYNTAEAVRSDLVYLVEGEKDVETLRRLGKVAVSPPDGAGSAWKEQYTETLRNRHVIIIPDNDAPGIKFASMAAVALQKAAKSVRMLDLSNAWRELPIHGDTTDIVEHFGESEGLEKIEALAKLATAWDEPEEEAAEGATDVLPDFFDGKRFLHHVMGDYLISRCNVCRINGDVHVYNDGIYMPGESVIHGIMIQIMPDITHTRRKEVYKYIEANRRTPEREVSPPHLIPFATKIYDLEAEEFIDYSPDHVFLNRFPYDYKPDAPECETVTKTIRDIAAGDDAVMDLLYEAMGNCFYMVNSFRGAVMLYGRSGNNGKSTLLNMITQLIGRKNASFLSLQDTAERFRLADVYGKAANIGDDISNAFLSDSSIFKKLVTGEEITAERKGRDPFSFRPYAKFFFALNGLPPVGDKSKAFFGRVLLVPLNKDFSQAGDVSLKNRTWTTEEMECLTRHAMEGLKRLRAAGRFTMPECVKEALEEYERENNPVKEFLDEMGSVEGRPTQEVYNNYNSWSIANGHKNVMTRKRFTKEVCEQTGLESGAIRRGGGVVRSYMKRT